jgi:hypothetical protein
MTMAGDPGGTYGSPRGVLLKIIPNGLRRSLKKCAVKAVPRFAHFPRYVRIGTEGSAVDENDRREFEKVVSVYKTLKVNADLNEIAKE